MDNVRLDLEREASEISVEETKTKVLVLPADIVFPPELCDFLAQVMIRIAKEKNHAS